MGSGTAEGAVEGLTAGVGVGSGVGELVMTSVEGLIVGSLLTCIFPLEQLVAKNRMHSVAKRDFLNID